nr:eosinophil peroxidase [Vicugna pacos]
MWLSQAREVLEPNQTQPQKYTDNYNDAKLCGKSHMSEEQEDLATQVMTTFPGAVDTSVLQSCITKAKLLVDSAYNQTERSIKQRLRSGLASPMDLLSYFKQPVAATRIAVRAADYMHVALGLLEEKLQFQESRSFNVTDVLTKPQLRLLSQASGCAVQDEAEQCSDKYRTITGRCNNRRRPLLGAANQALARWLPAQYEDGVSLPFGWTPGKRRNGFLLPLVSDTRSTETPKLAAMHTLFVREHNRLATELRRLNPRWTGDKLYQEARKILGAMVQIITYRDFLPLVLGRARASRTLGPYRGYCSNVDPRVANVFTLAFRFGHTMLRQTSQLHCSRLVDPKNMQKGLNLHTAGAPSYSFPPNFIHLSPPSCRFWWQKRGVFTKRQRQALRQISLSRIVCDNTGITTVPRDIFKANTYPLGFVNCNSIPRLNLSAWRGT